MEKSEKDVILEALSREGIKPLYDAGAGELRVNMRIGIGIVRFCFSTEGRLTDIKK